MLHRVNVEPKALDEYRTIVGDEEITAIRALAEPLRGARVLHVNATTFGGGVAEILSTLVPLMKDIGIEAEWQVLHGADEFFKVTKAFHNALQGATVPITEEMKEVYNRHNRLNAEALEGEYDYLIIHDPQPAAILRFHGRTGSRHWIWRCHIDTSAPNPEAWDFLSPYLEAYDVAIFTMERYVHGEPKFHKLAIIPPSIDPLSPKNKPQTLKESQAILARFKVDTSRPLLTQVSRFDPWKDPLGVIDAYRMVKVEMPEVQLALVGSMATDDPQGWEYYERTVRHAGEDYDIHILHNLHGVGNVEVNAFQSASDVIIQKSIREGFGLVVTEALWKGKPVVGSNVGGIPLQIIDGENGFLVNDIEECADRVLYLLQNPSRRAKKMGAKAREHVRKRFLSPRHLKDYLRLFLSL
ncbi:MAG: glycosyltransferase [Anaerolineae bacterium]